MSFRPMLTAPAVTTAAFATPLGAESPTVATTGGPPFATQGQAP